MFVFRKPWVLLHIIVLILAVIIEKNLIPLNRIKTKFNGNAFA